MKATKHSVLDANILIRAVLGVQAQSLLVQYHESISFWAPEVCFQDARRHIHSLAEKKAFDPASYLQALDELESIVLAIEPVEYAQFEATARPRIAPRDESDWPIVADSAFAQLSYLD